MHLEFIELPGSWEKMLPLTYTRPVADLRVGILRMHEKWSKHLGASSHSYKTQEYLKPVFSESGKPDSTRINSNVLPNSELVSEVEKLSSGQALYKDQLFLASRGEENTQVNFEGEISLVEYPWDIFRLTKQEIELDYDLITAGRTSAPISDPHTKIYGDRIFLEEGAETKAAILNAEKGSIYLGKNSRVGEGAVVSGAFSLGEESQVSIGAKIRGETSVGPQCKVGGEISNSVFHGFSNKSHDGFLGNSVIGEWCNIGADSNNSNLKNNYTNVKMWDFQSGRFKDTGLQFCGLIMGDHSKCGINTMFNTGTTVGVSANIFGAGFPRTIIHSFAWGGSGGFTTYQVKKACETANLVMQRRGLQLSAEGAAIMEHIFNITAENRIWDK